MAVKTLQLFESYLPNAQNWVFRMLNNLSDTEVNVAAYRYYNEQFVTRKINLLPMPEYVSPDLLEGRDHAKNIFSKIINRIAILRKNKHYFEYIGKWANENGVELIHTHFANMGWQYLELKKITGLPYFVSFYGFDYESLPFRFRNGKSVINLYMNRPMALFVKVLSVLPS